LEIAVISDVHLGTHGCHANELLAYLSSIQPKMLILNGDIIAISKSHKNYFPASHLNVLHKIISMATKGTEVYYITGSHHDKMHKFIETAEGNIHLVDQLTLNLDGKRAWFFHGDILDFPLGKAKWIVNLGTYGFNILMRLNRFFNWVQLRMGMLPNTLSKNPKQDSIKTEKYIVDFETTVIDLALEKQYDYVICGHTHRPKKEIMEQRKGTCTYLNAGDWVDHLSALEYSFKRWKLYRYQNDKLSPFFMDEKLKAMNIHDIIAKVSTTKNEENKNFQKIQNVETVRD
jgi:UDP-2,3-diacylglucosamine pyrophosphatase LpxH